MKKITSMLALIALVFTLFSFTLTSNSDIYGTYGVSNNDPSGIALVLNKDHTFTYQDNSNPDKKIDTKGTWVQKNDHVILTNFESKYSFHTKWKISEDGKMAQSRKGLTFYTLCKNKSGN